MASDSDDLAIHRAVYRDAYLRGDPLAVTRAAARLRAYITDLDARELTAVRASRQRFGRAIREARSRRLAPLVLPGPVGGLPLTPPRRLPVRLAASLALLALVVAAVTVPLRADQTDGGAGAAAAEVRDPVIQPVSLSRGRVMVPVAAVQPVAQPPQAAPAAEAAPEATAAPSGANAAPGGGVAGGRGAPGSGTGTGSGGGNGAGSPSRAPTATRTPAPTFAICFSSVPPGFARLCGQVVDGRTGRGLPDACVSLGPCTTQSTRTDPNGRWTFPLVVGDGTLIWFLEFSKPGYTTSTFSQTSRQGRVLIPTLVLVPY